MDAKENQRDKIIGVLEKNPGLHFRALQRETNLAVGQLEYHLYQLEKLGNISSRRDGRFKRYFISDNSTLLDKKISYYLRNKKAREIIIRLLRKSPENSEELRIKLKMKRDEMEQLINNMIDDMIIVNEGKQLSIAAPTQVKKAIRSVKASFLSELAESLIDLLDTE